MVQPNTGKTPKIKHTKLGEFLLNHAQQVVSIIDYMKKTLTLITYVFFVWLAYVAVHNIFFAHNASMGLWQGLVVVYFVMLEILEYQLSNARKQIHKQTHAIDLLTEVLKKVSMGDARVSYEDKTTSKKNKLPN